MTGLLWLGLMIPGALRADPVDAILDAMGVPEIVAIMREEGLLYGEDMARDMLPGGASDGWRALVSEIYGTERMEDVVRAAFRREFGNADPTPVLDFFTSQAGTQIVALELSARRAMVDDDVEEEARAAYRALQDADDPRLARIRDFVAANDLIDANVVGAMNASYQFYRGLVDGGAFSMTEEEILIEVWSQEDQTRSDTEEWVYGFLLLAYGPLDEETLETYIALSATPEGRRLNGALFAGFNAMYDNISYALGLAAASQMKALDL
ncbi:DUF2059 domain-containing protein [Thalassococcus sp. CAU 1522]|uniref:DUF2059 domain-containing protein n=2 Tax=Thalassococcus arenae TaxID=2851652 RepID=A0ABS6N9V3_9RHOB|nr:DUF2059 domain-containing protein [Thalassococcus arenae]